MHDHYSTLQVLFELVKDSPHPAQYACRPAEIIARHHEPWDVIMLQLEQLAAEGLILYTGPAVITITEEGMRAAASQTVSLTLKDKVA